MSYHYFSDDDFKKAKPPCSIDDMDEELLKKLDAARIIADIPFIITSAKRSRQYELDNGRDGTSSHIRALAVDISARTTGQKFTIVTALLAAGFTRIGVYQYHIHADIDPNKPEDKLWRG